jgi:prepilin-type N-terminal cleavage/methylation domain-containing protein
MQECADRGAAATPIGAGFTLVEIMVSALVLAIGMMAALAMQYAALGGVTGSQDLTNATELSERMLQVVRHESQQWRGRTANVSSIESVYNASNAPWNGANVPVLPAVKAESWTWLALTSQPVDVRFTNSGRQRYCVYVRGGETNTGRGVGGEFYKVQVAVVYPGGTNVFPDANSTGAPAGKCTSLDVSSGYLEPPTTGSGPSAFERDGYRAVFSGAIITERGYLGPAVSG